MHPLVKKFEAKHLESFKDLVNKVHYKVGDLLRVRVSVEENGKKWIQTSEGICIRKISRGLSSTFTIRRIEKDTAILMTFSPYFQNLVIEILSMANVKRSKLYYLEKCSVKAGRLKQLTHKQILKRKAYEEKEGLNG